MSLSATFNKLNPFKEIKNKQKNFEFLDFWNSKKFFENQKLINKNVLEESESDLQEETITLLNPINRSSLINLNENEAYSSIYKGVIPHTEYTDNPRNGSQKDSQNNSADDSLNLSVSSELLDFPQTYFNKYWPEDDNCDPHSSVKITKKGVGRPTRFSQIEKEVIEWLQNAKVQTHKFPNRIQLTKYCRTFINEEFNCSKGFLDKLVLRLNKKYDIAIPPGRIKKKKTSKQQN